MNKMENSSKHDHFLKEVKTLFPKQKKTDAIEIFMEIFLKKYNKKLYPGGRKIVDQMTMLLPNSKPYSIRMFDGSYVSHSIASNLNTSYGIFAFTASLLAESNDSLSNEILRGFFKNIISLCAEKTKISINTIKTNDDIDLPKDINFYLQIFDSGRIINQMRSRSRRRLLEMHSNKSRKMIVSSDDEYIYDSFCSFCEDYNLGIAPLLRSIRELHPIKRAEELDLINTMAESINLFITKRTKKREIKRKMLAICTSKKSK